MRSRQKIIEATLRLIESDGFGAVNIAAIAAAAGVSRQTVYTIFGSRENLFSQALAETAVAALTEIRERLDRLTDPGEVLIELMVAGRAVVHANPALVAMVGADNANPLFEVGMMEKAKAVVAGFLPDTVLQAPAIVPVRDEVVEMTTRLAISVIFFDSEALRDDDDLRAFLGRWLLPAIAALPH